MRRERDGEGLKANKRKEKEGRGEKKKGEEGRGEGRKGKEKGTGQVEEPRDQEKDQDST